jgi:hypothetical protein
VPPSLHWVPWVGSPVSSVLRGTPIACRPSRRTSLPSLGDTAVLHSFAPVRERSAANRPGLWSPVPRPEFPERRRQALPGSRGTPREHALATDPDETPTSTVATTQRCCLRLDIMPRLSHEASYGAQSHGLLAPCERFAARVATGLAHHSVPAGDRPWPGRVRRLQGSYTRFRVDQFISSSLSGLARRTWR